MLEFGFGSWRLRAFAPLLLAIGCSDGGNQAEPQTQATSGPMGSSPDTTATGQVQDLDAEPVQRADFCTSLKLAHCEGTQTCCTDSERKFSTVAECLQLTALSCDLGYLVSDPDNQDDPWQEAAYDPDSAGLELARYRQALSTCEEQYVVDFSALFEDGAFPVHCSSGLSCPAGSICGSEGSCERGALLAGQSCQYSEQCEQGSYCPRPEATLFSDDDGDLSTPSHNDDADPDSVDGDASRQQCRPGTRSLGSECYPGECPKELYCEGSVPDPNNGVGWTLGACAERAPNGASCFSMADCASLFCAGASLQFDWEIISGSDSAPRPPTAGTCSACGATDCGDFACEQGACQLGVMRRDEADGAACTLDGECRSGACLSGICVSLRGNDLYCPMR